MKHGPVTLVLDQGTHASRAALIAADGSVLYHRDLAISMNRPGARRAEQNPEEILASVQRVASAAIQIASVSGWRLERCGLATQRSSLLAWRRDNGEPLGPVLSWQDTRGAALVKSLADHAAEIGRLTGLPLSAHYGASKMRWLIDNRADVADAAAQGNLCIGPLSSFILRHLLVGQPTIADAGNASRTQLMELQTRRWSSRLMDLFGIQPEWLPEVVPVRRDFGFLSGTEIPLSASHGDQPAALLGCGGKGEGEVVVNLGTGAFVMLDTGTRAVRHPALLTALLDSVGSNVRFCLEGTVNGAGSALDWIRRTQDIAPEDYPDWADVTAPPLFLNTVGGLGSPWWRHGPAPGFIGESGLCETGNAARVAAVMESIAFLIRANLESMREAGCTPTHVNAGGGLSREDAFCQRLADTTGLEVRRVTETEITALGMARLAGNTRIENPVDRVFPPRSGHPSKKRYQRFIALVGDPYD